MKLFTKTITTFFVLFLSTSFLVAQDAPELKWKIGGTVQAMGSYAQTNTDTAQMGLGLRRIRLKTYFNYGKVSAFIQYSAKSNRVLDARMTYKLSKAANIRVGRFIGAGVRSGGLTSHTVIDIVERPMSAQMWAVTALGSADYRDYGLAFMGKVGDFSYNMTLANGKGLSKVKLEGITVGVGTGNILATQLKGGGTKNQSFSISGMASFKPKVVKGLEVGGYYGIGNTNFRNYSSYNAYVYWEPKPIRIKAEIIGVTDKNGTDNISSLGYYVFGAFGFMDNWEALVRYENYNPSNVVEKDAHTLITIGARYALYPAKLTASKITFAYILHGEEGTAINNDVFYVMFQTAF